MCWKLTILLTLVAIFKFWPPEKNNYKSNINLFLPINYASSIYCENCNERAKCCIVKNLYFWPKERTFSIVLTEDSQVHGIFDYKDLLSLSVTSVLNHTDLFLPLVVMFEQDQKLQSIKSIDVVMRPVFLLHRFKPDNVMHVLHDDLLPLFARYEVLCGRNGDCLRTKLLAFIDPLAAHNSTYGSAGWYEMMSVEPIYPLLNEPGPVLLSEAHFGLPGTTLSFQYGFGTVQGPVAMSAGAMGVMGRFAHFARAALGAKPLNNSRSGCAVLLSRRETRRIVNQEEVIEQIGQAYHGDNQTIAVRTLDLRDAAISQVLDLVSQADLIVGMHGAALYLAALFSKRGAGIVELFPYGIQPQFVSPVRSMAQHNAWFHYASWENLDSTASFPPPPSSPALQGGLSHLSPESRRTVLESLPVPAVPCCHHPAYLYRMFQDTRVGGDFLEAVSRVRLLQGEPTSGDLGSSLLLPGAVLNLTCQENKVSWSAPLNLCSCQLRGRTLLYEFTGLTRAGDLLENSLQGTHIHLTSVGVDRVWVRACVGTKCGKDSFVNC